MEATKDHNCYAVGVLVVSDTVYAGEKKDTSGVSIIRLLESEKFFRASQIHSQSVADDSDGIQSIIKCWVDSEHLDLILTVGGTGFSPRDVTPEATKAVIEREAPHLASHMILGCYEKSKFSVLSRSACGTRGKSLILNLPGSEKGAVECFEMVAALLPHALDQLMGKTRSVAAVHCDTRETHTHNK